MHDCGLYAIEDMRPVNELRMRARWKLGRALKAWSGTLVSAQT
jgi:hypothetical protein